MTTVTVWILISISAGFYNQGTTTVIAHFADARTCEKAAEQIKGANDKQCIQAEIVATK